AALGSRARGPRSGAGGDAAAGRRRSRPPAPGRTDDGAARPRPGPARAPPPPPAHGGHRPGRDRHLGGPPQNAPVKTFPTYSRRAGGGGPFEGPPLIENAICEVRRRPVS